MQSPGWPRRGVSLLQGMDEMQEGEVCAGWKDGWRVKEPQVGLLQAPVRAAGHPSPHRCSLAPQAAPLSSSLACKPEELCPAAG